MALFTGAGVAIVTPFKDGKVDFPSLGQLIDWQISQGIDAIVVCGTTGEASTLNDKEHIETVKYTVDKVNRRVPVIGGAGSNDTAHAVYMSKELEDVGVDGLLLVTPYYNKCTQKGLVKHYTTIADAVNIPIILYSVAGRTGVNISPSTVFELAKHPRIVGIKEASGNISQVVEIAKCVSDDFALYSGNDDMIVPLLSVGGLGVISTVANVAPKDTHDMVMSYLEGDVTKAGKLQIKMKSLIDAMFIEVNPIPVKAALNLMGKIESEYRLPLCPPEEKSMEIIRKELLNYGLITS
ncbi:4-hydroxy-tetrahydrodipicolinate synthase [Sinanaerobacter chloroacetimidivorans]|uniref:4-hydroxy-tetrahydrodipicolinate synthase n=1 Tax=Sinanaerobacter chloroacetimidivorans TaxID=2818044 RepID=A0A8J7VXJ6_9FIRM|nr:4-hydroxy-tetrahydrodipicolinate synthase [Sinanaerobacter chloroacetimidivorans]MBR0596541.1 4-hydroxy-tetrahydrodipicolinate synthase [Sinanaerobacter chloroacetimidivorans]